jgi:UDP-N-acetylglucosamine 2-epimerase (non-hydrolysing)
MPDSSTEVLLTLGTRPEIIKLAPVIRSLESTGLQFRVLHTGQHYDDDLSGVFFENLNLPRPDISLEVGSGTQGEQTADALVGIEAALDETEPAAVLALGDTNAVLSTALAASKTSVEFAHLEAGIRSFDRSMPEEVNRVVADRLADLAFAPTERAVENLTNEGITDGVHMVGNTVVDACRQHADIAAEQSDVLDRFSLDRNGYVVATIHRPRNTDDADRLRTIVEALDDQSVPVVFPAHPRTAGALDDIGYRPEGSLTVIEPLDYLDFLHLLGNARVAVTDSGGIQEEASIIEIPCLTVRPNTERPETVEAGVNELLEPGDLHAKLDAVVGDDALCASMTGHPDLYGDGAASDRILDVLIERYS